MIPPRRRAWLGPALILAATAAMIIFLRSFLVRLILEPIAWLLWAGWRLAASVDRGVCWALLVLVCAAVVIRLASAGFGSHDDDQDMHGSDPDARSRIDHWQAVAARARLGKEGRAALRTSLGLLAASVAEATRRRPPHHLSMEVPTSTAESLLSSQIPRRPVTPPVTALLNWLFPGRGRRADSRATEELLDWMESAMEITHEP